MPLAVESRSGAPSLFSRKVHSHKLRRGAEEWCIPLRTNQGTHGDTSPALIVGVLVRMFR